MGKLEALLQAVEAARETLAGAITKRAELDHIVSKVIYMKFLAHFGELEIREHALRYREMYMTAKIRWIHAFAAENLPVNLQMVQRELNADLKDYADYINGLEALWKKSMRQYRAEEHMAELRKSNRAHFQQLVEELSPDVYPHTNEKRTQLYREAEEAFRAGDIMRMRNLYETGLRTRTPAPPVTEAGLREELLRLEERIREVNAWIALRESATPFEYKDLVEDEAQITTRIDASFARIARLETVVTELQQTVTQLLREHPEVDTDPFDSPLA